VVDGAIHAPSGVGSLGALGAPGFKMDWVQNYLLVARWRWFAMNDGAETFVWKTHEAAMGVLSLKHFTFIGDSIFFVPKREITALAVIAGRLPAAPPYRLPLALGPFHQHRHFRFQYKSSGSNWISAFNIHYVMGVDVGRSFSSV